MEQTALRPRPMPGDGGGGSGDGPGSGPPGRRPGRRRGRRVVTAVLGALTGAVLVLSGAGLGAVGATIAGAGGLTGLKRQAGADSAVPAASPRSAPSEPVARLGVEVADDEGPGALVVGVHVPGPGASAGLARGDVLLAFGATRVDSAAGLARAVARARPGDEVTLTVRRRGGGHQQLTAVPGIVT